MTDSLPSAAARRGLADFGAALQAGDIDGAVALFGAESYWRDLVAFTWNIRTQEGPAAVREMLAERLADTAPSAFAFEGRVIEAGGVIDAWFGFETKVARGRGHLKVRQGLDTPAARAGSSCTCVEAHPPLTA
jgi:putative flavoprotein involved in K+ transport